MEIEFNSFSVKSRKGPPATYTFRKHSKQSETLVVAFPGQAYKMDAPLMWYSALVALESGSDVLGIEYSFQVGGEPRENLPFPVVVEEVSKAVKAFVENHEYRRIVFLAKSIGTEIAARIAGSGEVHVSKYVFLTPLESTIELINSAKEMMVVVGDSDPVFPESCIRKILDLSRVTIIEGGNHLLEIPGNALKSIDILKEVAEKITGFLRNDT